MLERTFTFSVLPADAIFPDALSASSGVSTDEAARFLYLAGLYFIREYGFKIGDYDEMAKRFSEDSDKEQRQHVKGVSRYYFGE